MDADWYSNYDDDSNQDVWRKSWNCCYQEFLRLNAATSGPTWQPIETAPKENG